jgi:transcriptional regulator with XRE-family HTH domain
MRTKSDPSSEEEKKIIRIVGERIANKRRRLGKSQEVLSGEAQISKGNLSMIEEGSTSNPTLLTLIRISRQLDMSLSELFKSVEEL